MTRDLNKFFSQVQGGAGRRCKRTESGGAAAPGVCMTGSRRFVGRPMIGRGRYGFVEGICTRISALDLQKGTVYLSQGV